LRKKFRAYNNKNSGDMMEKNIKINYINDGFWSPKLKTFREVTLPDTFDKLIGDGALENFEKVINNSGSHKICPWHDGLLYETIRGAADYLSRERDEALEARIDGVVSVIKEAQKAAGGGYISTYTLLERKNQRYGENGGNILWQHDLYNCGCLFEAGVHYYTATGKAGLLECALKCANELAGLIGKPPKKWIVPGHCLPEYALLELYELVSDEAYIRDIEKKIETPIEPKAYLELADFWVRGRGHHKHRTNHPQYMGEYAQDHAPVHHQFQAVGHAVRAVLYYTGVTRPAILQNDRELLGDSLRLWKNVILRKLHVNGGIGATHFEEKFGEDYNLPDDAYLESCASVGLIFWARALFEAADESSDENLGEYYNVIERALYNIMLSSVSLRGDGYFYRNPLISNGEDHRWSWNGCPCCPPMIHKLFGAFHEYIYAVKDDTCYVNLYVSSEAEIKLKGGGLTLKQQSSYPWEGKIKITAEKINGSGIKIALRIPEWAESASAQNLPVKNGYAVWESIRPGDEIELDFEMSAKRIQSHPYVHQNRGRAAVQRGPLVYCAEGADNSGKTDFILAENPEFTEVYEKELLGGVVSVTAKDSNNRSFKLIPLYAWDNRTAASMRVWFDQETAPNQNAGAISSWETDRRLYRLY
jgi:DUF1680 family protein